MAEFEVNEAGGLRLKQYGIKSLGAEGAQESTREATILKALNAMIAEKGIKAKAVKEFGFEAGHLPRGAKRKLKDLANCEPKLFPSEHAFDHAWSKSGLKGTSKT